MPPESDLSKFTEEELDRALALESGEVNLSVLSDAELDAQLELAEALQPPNPVDTFQDAIAGAGEEALERLVPIPSGEGVDGKLRSFKDVAADTTEIGLEMGLSSVLPGAAARLVGRGTTGLGAGIGRALGFGASGGISSAVVDEIFDGEVNFSDALVKSGLAATAGAAFELLPFASKAFKSRDAQVVAKIKKAANAEEDIIAALKPTASEFNPFSGRSAAADIRSAIYETDLFEGVADFPGLQKKLLERVGGKDPATGKLIQGEVGARIGTLAREIDTLPTSKMRFSEIDAYVDEALPAQLGPRQLTRQGDSVTKFLDTRRRDLRKKIAALNLFPDEGLSQGAVKKLDKQISSLKGEISRMQTQISDASDAALGVGDAAGKKLSAIKLEGIQARLGEKTRRLDLLEREVANPEVSFEKLIQIQRGFDDEAAKSFDKAKDALTPSGEASLIIANAVRKAEKDLAVNSTAELAPELGEAFLAAKSEFHKLKNIDRMIARAAASSDGRLTARGLQKIGEVYQDIRNVVSPVAVNIGRGIDREAVLSRGVKSVSGLNFDRPIASTTPLDAITSRPSLPTMIGVAAVTHGGKYLGLTDDRESLVTSLMGAMFTRQGVDLGDGVDEATLPDELTRDARFQATSAVSALEEAERRLGRGSMEYARALSNFSVEFPEIFGRPKSGIPGEVVVDGKRMLPNENQRLSYSNKLKASSKLDKLQKAKMRSAAHRGDVISQSKASKSNTSFRSQAALEEDG